MRSWRILSYRLAGEGSRDRVAVWREMRRVGAVALQQGTWALPPGEGFDQGVERAVELIERAGGRPLLFDVAPSPETASALEELFSAERDAEWAEFISECDKAEAELRGEIDKRKFTLAELDEEEHNVDRLRRWYRELRARDLFGASSAATGEVRLKEVGEVLEEFAERVFEARERP